MTRRLPRPITLSVIAVLLLAGLAVWLGRQQPVPPRLEMYHLHDCPLPCWVGITPGQTTIGEAKARLEQTYPASDYNHDYGYQPLTGASWLKITRHSDSISLSVNFNERELATAQNDNTLIQQITLLASADNHLTLGDWIQVLGEPQALSLTWGHYAVNPNALFYKHNVRVTLYNPVEAFAVENAEIAAPTLDIYAQLEQNFLMTTPWKSWQTSYRDKLMALMIP